MGNVAVSFIEVGMALNDNVTTKRQETRERKRLTSLIPRYLRALRNFDTSITRLDLNGLGVDAHDIRLFSIPLISGHTRVTELYLEGNQIGVEGSTAIAKIIASARYLKDVSLANNPGKRLKCVCLEAMYHCAVVEFPSFSHAIHTCAWPLARACFTISNLNKPNTNTTSSSRLF